jgi:5-methyltetrahydropteroyltriglutamate--homocysteine methyltransferase
MSHTTSGIPTTHVGSLPRPEVLDDAVEHQADTSGESTYEGVLKDSVRDIVARQADIGLDIVNDGELGKSSWTGYVSERLGGFEARPATAGVNPLMRGKDRADFPEFYAEAERNGTLWHRPDGRLRGRPAPPVRWACTAPVTYTGQAALTRDIQNFRAALADVDVADAFLPVAAPASLEPGRANEYYNSEEEYVYALADALRIEYETIVDAGFLLQVDDAWIPALWDRLLPNIQLEDYRRRCMLRIEALNHALRSVPEERVRYHICWGSWHGPHSTDIPMRDLVDLMLCVKARAYVFEAANVRHEHEYHVWDDVRLPDGKVLVPGVVSHATNVLEHPELVAERILRFAERVGSENVMAGTDCGLGGRVHPELAWAKLRVLVEGSALASKSRRAATLVGGPQLKSTPVAAE